MNDENCSQVLRDFFSSYFHEDWSGDAEGIEGVLGEYIKQNPDSLVLDRLSGCILSLVDSKVSDVDLGKVLFSDFGCYYAPSADGKTARVWLKEVVRILEMKKPK